MPTDKPRISFAVPDDLHERIDAFRFDHRVKNLSQAVITLLERGLNTLDAESTAENEKLADVGELSENQKRFLWMYRQLGDDGVQLIDSCLKLSPVNRRLLIGFAELMLQAQELPPVPQE